MTPLIDAVRKEIARRRLPTRAAAARAIGVGDSSLDRLLRRQRKPNASTIPFYAAFLGSTEDDVRRMADGHPALRRLRPPAMLATVAVPKRPRSISWGEACQLVADDLALQVHRTSPALRERIQQLLAEAAAKDSAG